MYMHESMSEVADRYHTSSVYMDISVNHGILGRHGSYTASFLVIPGIAIHTGLHSVEVRRVQLFNR